MKKEEYQNLFDVGLLFRTLFIDYYYDSYKKDLTYQQTRVFDYICSHKQVTANQMTSIFSLSKQHMALIVNKLHSLYLIDKKQSQQDKRYTYLIPTKKGEQYYQEHIQLSYTHYEALKKKLNKKQKELLYENIECLNELLKQMQEE